MKDYDFLFNNKVSHIMAWVREFPDKDRTVDDFEGAGIKLIVLEDMLNESPMCEDLQQCVSAISESREEFLCSLLFADQIVDVLPLLVAYLENRYHVRNSDFRGTGILRFHFCRKGWPFRISKASNIKYSRSATTTMA